VQRILLDAPSVDADADKDGKEIAITNENADEVLNTISKFYR
jgi:hypothetical protein